MKQFQDLTQGETFIPSISGLGKHDIAIKTVKGFQAGYTYLNTGNHSDLGRDSLVQPGTLCEVIKGHFQED